MAEIACIGCGGIFEDREGPTHRYMESSPGCWAVYGEVLAREYSDPSYASLHRLTTDAYAVQHPGRPSPQSVQSVALHLMSLCLVLERGLDPNRTTAFLKAAAGDKESYVWLAPPLSLGAITVQDVHRAASAWEHKRLVRAWAESAWTAWSAHHATIARWLVPWREEIRLMNAWPVSIAPWSASSRERTKRSTASPRRLFPESPLDHSASVRYTEIKLSHLEKHLS